MNKFKRGLVAAISAGLVVTGGAMGPTLMTAHAFEETVKTLPTQDVANLTIHKFAEPESATGLPNDGRKLTAGQLTGLKGLPGAEYEVTKVQGIDLKTNQGWRDAATVTRESAATRLEVGTTKTTKTNGDGVAELQGLPVGLYLVKEKQAPAGYKASDPFLVTLPLTNPQDRTEWLYDVHVYPKNTEVPQGKPSKTVADKNKNADDRITYSITAPIANYDNVTYVRVDDEYSTGRLSDPKVELTEGNKVEVTNGDKTVELTTDDFNSGSPVDGKYLLELNESGLAKVNELGNDKARTLTYKLSFKVLPVAGDAQGKLNSVDNTLKLHQSNHVDHKPTTPGGGVPPLEPPTGPAGPPPTTTPPGGDPLTRTYFGNVRLEKLSAKDNSPIDGVVFDIYRCNDTKELTAAIKAGNAGTPIRTETTKDGGVATFLGLHANNFEDNEGKVSDPKGYCLVEKQAHSEHELLAEPVFFQVMADLNTHTVARVDIKTDEVKNVPSFGLPLTGGAGIWMIIGTGLLLLITASGYFVFRQRQA